MKRPRVSPEELSLAQQLLPLSASWTLRKLPDNALAATLLESPGEAHLPPPYTTPSWVRGGSRSSWPSGTYAPSRHSATCPVSQTAPPPPQ